MAKKKLSLDLDTILPGEVFKIGSETIIIRPLMFEQYSNVIKQIRFLVKELIEQGITFENYEKGDNFLIIVEMLLTDFPTVLEEASGIDIESLNQLPIDIILALVVTILEVNLRAKDSFLGNFQSLSGLINQIFQERKPKAKTRAPRKTKK